MSHYRMPMIPLISAGVKPLGIGPLVAPFGGIFNPNIANKNN
jgi:hypothetical protein